MSSHDARAESEKAGQHPGQPSPNQVGVTPSGMNGENPATAGPGKTEVKSKTPEGAHGHLNPSAPEDANVTPGSTSKK